MQLTGNIKSAGMNAKKLFMFNSAADSEIVYKKELKLSRRNKRFAKSGCISLEAVSGDQSCTLAELLIDIGMVSVHDRV